MLTCQGAFVRSTSGNKGNELNELNNPRDLCFTRSNEWIVVTDSGNHRLVIYELRSFEAVRVIGGEISSLALHLPYGICCDEHDRLYVCDRGNHRIVVIDFQTSSLVLQWGKKGSQPGDFDAPDYISCRKNIIAVSDFNNHRIQVFNLNGQFLFNFGRLGNGFDREFRYPRGITIDNEGFFMVSNTILSINSFFFLKLIFRSGC